ncbi:pur operon repressor [Bacillus kwashiorkori]|uniref:pur operon repressor n=1 Tax=Bacillus kwashiorkori TaxID=1522318 RepID=UPI000780ED1B|nr:pur operon repressor [Bacillus kwashiorkori]
MNWKRSERLVDMTNYLLNNPRKIIPLTYFVDKYGAAKSSISEDISIIKETFNQQGIGILKTLAGASGGVIYSVNVRSEDIQSSIHTLCEWIEKPDRILPGGYLYMADIIGNPHLMDEVGKILASKYIDKDIDVVMTVATKGITLAYATARYLNVPVVIVRRDSKITEGSTVSINYVSGSTKKIQSMVLARKSLKEGSKVLIVDDFMKAGGTVNGMISLLEEFRAELAGIAVLIEADYNERLINEYTSIIKLTHVDEKEKKIVVSEGNILCKEV